MMSILQNSFANTSSSLMVSKVQGNIVDVLMPPMSPAELTLAFAGGGLTRGTANSVYGGTIAIQYKGRERPTTHTAASLAAAVTQVSTPAEA